MILKISNESRVGSNLQKLKIGPVRNPKDWSISYPSVAKPRVSIWDITAQTSTCTFFFNLSFKDRMETADRNLTILPGRASLENIEAT